MRWTRQRAFKYAYAANSSPIRLHKGSRKRFDKITSTQKVSTYKTFRFKSDAIRWSLFRARNDLPCIDRLSRAEVYPPLQRTAVAQHKTNSNLKSSACFNQIKATFYSAGGPARPPTRCATCEETCPPVARSRARTDPRPPPDCPALTKREF